MKWWGRSYLGFFLSRQGQAKEGWLGAIIDVRIWNVIAGDAFAVMQFLH